MKKPSSSAIKELRFPHNTKLVSVVEAETVAFLLFSSNAARVKKEERSEGAHNSFLRQLTNSQV